MKQDLSKYVTEELCAYHVVVLCLWILLSPVVHQATTATADDNSIPIGAVLILSGSEAMYGVAFKEGIELAVEEINREGGVRGRPFRVIYEDSGNKPRAAHTAAKKLIDHDRVIAALNSSFTEVMANGPLFEKARIPAITLWDTAQQIEQLGDYIFGIGIYTPSAGMTSAQFAYHELKGRTCVVINMHNEWGDTVSKIFTEQFQRMGGKVLKTFELDPTTTDFRTVISKTKVLQPDFVYTPLVENVIPFYSQLKSLRFSGQIVTSDIISEQHIKEAPFAFEGVYQTQALVPSSARTQHLVQLYKHQFNRPPTMILFNAWGYDATWMLAHAIERVGFDPHKVKDELYRVQGYEGASGTISINEHGSSPKMEQMFQVQKGKFVLMKMSG